MSGYLEGVLVLLAVNVVFAYGGFLPLAAFAALSATAAFAQQPASPPAPPAVRVRGVRRSFEAELAPVRALRGLDLDVAAGEFVALMGPSGCGKSTLLNVIAGLDRPDEGSVEVAGVGRRLDEDVLQDLEQRVEPPRPEQVGRPPRGRGGQWEGPDAVVPSFGHHGVALEQLVRRSSSAAGAWDQWGSDQTDQASGSVESDHAGLGHAALQRCPFRAAG